MIEKISKYTKRLKTLWRDATTTDKGDYYVPIIYFVTKIMKLVGRFLPSAENIFQKLSKKIFANEITVKKDATASLGELRYRIRRPKATRRRRSCLR